MLNKYIILMRAIIRLSPRMILFMVRRLVRNSLAVRFRSTYRSRLNRIVAGLPKLGLSSNISPGLERAVDFYCAEYNKMVDGISLGKVCLYGRTVDFGTVRNIDWNYRIKEEGDHQMWRIKLAHMGFVCPMLVGDDKSYHNLSAILIEDALGCTDMTVSGAFNAFWFPYAASHRVIAIGSGLLMARTKGSLSSEVDAIIADFLKLNVAFVLDNIEHELCNNHVERNLAALCLYFSYVDAVPSIIAERLERDIDHLLTWTILPDGTQVERSPMYQGLSVVSLEIMSEAKFLSAGLRKRLKVKVKAVRCAFAILCHPDGEVALFNDSWHGEVPRWSGEAAPDGRSVLPQGGYGRLSEGKDLCLMDAGPLGPSWNPGHGHADFLSIEITLGGHRVIVDPGTSRYNSGSERARERSAVAHNGPIWCGHEPVEFLSSFKVGRLNAAQLVKEALLPLDVIAGFVSYGPGAIGRMIRHYCGKGYLIADIWFGQEAGQVSWLVPASWEINTEECAGFVLSKSVLDAKVFISPLLPVAEMRLVASTCSHNYGHTDKAWLLCLSSQGRGKSQALLTWVGYEMAPETALDDGVALLGELGVLKKNGNWLS